MEIVKKYGNSIWRIPLISILGGLCYDPVYIKILMRFGISKSGELNRIATLWASGGLLLAVLLLGGFLLLRNLSQEEIFASAAVVAIYGLLLSAIQRLTGSTTGPAAIVFLYLFTPLNWTGFFVELFVYIKEKWELSLPFILWLSYLAPFMFMVFGRKKRE